MASARPETPASALPRLIFTPKKRADLPSPAPELNPADSVAPAPPPAPQPPATSNLQPVPAGHAAPAVAPVKLGLKRPANAVEHSSAPPPVTPVALRAKPAAEKTQPEEAAPVSAIEPAAPERPPPNPRFTLTPDAPALEPLRPMPPGLKKVSPLAAPAASIVRRRPLAARAVLLLVAVGLAVAAYFFRPTSDNQNVTANPTPQPPAATTTAPPTDPALVDVDHLNGPPPTPAAAYLKSLDFVVSTGAQPELLLSDTAQRFHPGDVIAPDLGLKWTALNEASRQLEFVDGAGHHYVKRF